MKTCGIVAEYNPFHNGHLHHICETRRLLGDDAVIVCAMSGNFVQRGEAALLPKYLRAETAVRAGADLVVETPLAACLSSAEGFAAGAVETLRACGCQTLSFGCEAADPALLQRAADALDRVPFTQLPHQSYAAAREAAVRQVDRQAADALRLPNNTLAIEYLRALRGTAIKPLAVLRRGAAHDAPDPQQENASARALRRMAKEGPLAALTPYLPPDSGSLLLRAQQEGILLRNPSEQTLLALLRRELKQGLQSSPDGFTERLTAAAHRAHDFSEVITLAQTRRFPAARVRRALWRILLALPPDTSSLPQYLRVLALGARGRKLLRQQKPELPVILKPVTEKRLAAALQPALQRDAYADDLYFLLCPSNALHACGAHYRQTPYCQKEEE